MSVDSLSICHGYAPLKIWQFVSSRQFLKIGCFRFLGVLLQPALPRFLLFRLISLAVAIAVNHFAFAPPMIPNNSDFYNFCSNVFVLVSYCGP
jgi:hypothetical protein